ncbi:MAG: hypothetical protein HOC20_00700 [Chloroflexi bacterium]|jgi:hypothetical protein|nr:hypothetical protein [Chloroflexota bacterium]
MAIDELTSLLNQVEKRFEQEGNLIQIESGRAIFVGDTHGDIDATQKIFEKYLNLENKIVFLGDYVDRGPASEENLSILLKMKMEYPDNLFLLMGNHEGQQAIPFRPADFWARLDRTRWDRYAEGLAKLPLAVSTSNGIIALHGALPEVETLRDIENIEFGSQQWRQITWGDWQETSGGYLGTGFQFGRLPFGWDWFEEKMNKLNKNVLIRSHQPNANQIMYGGRCLTIFTSSAYRSAVPQRTVAITDLSREVKTVDDLTLEAI